MLDLYSFFRVPGTGIKGEVVTILVPDTPFKYIYSGRISISFEGFSPLNLFEIPSLIDWISE